MIRPNGREPQQDIKISFTGRLRTGENFLDELGLEGEGIKPKPQDKRWVLEGGESKFATVRDELEGLPGMAESRTLRTSWPRH